MKKKLLIFLVICYGLSFTSAGVFYALGGKYKSILGSLIAMLYMLLPMISVLVTQMICREKPFGGCGIGFKVNRWWFIAWLGMLLMPVLVTLVSALMPGVGLTLESDLMRQSIASMSSKGVSVGPWGVMGITFLSALFAGATINAVFAFGEEVAWRGYLASLLRPLGFCRKSLIIGAIWGLWHAPLILMGHNYPSHPVAGVFMMIAFCTLLSPIFMFLKECSGSVIVAAIAHGTMNAIAGISLILLTGYNDLLCGMCGLAGLIVLALIDIFVFSRVTREKYELFK